MLLCYLLSAENHFSCTQCDYSCKQASHLKEHIRIYSGEKPFKCDQCNFSCNLGSYYDVTAWCAYRKFSVGVIVLSNCTLYSTYWKACVFSFSMNHTLLNIPNLVGICCQAVIIAIIHAKIILNKICRISKQLHHQAIPMLVRQGVRAGQVAVGGLLPAHYGFITPSPSHTLWVSTEIAL